MPTHPLILRALIGPRLDAFTVRPGETAMVGRLPYSDVCLMHEGVSRRHALLTSRAGDWFVTDQESAGGTFLNGVRLKAHEPAPLSDGDVLRIGPWTFRACIGEAAGAAAKVLDDNVTSGRRISRISSEGASFVSRRLTLLTRCIAKLGAIHDEQALVIAALDILLQGTGYGRAAVLRQSGVPGEFTRVAWRFADPGDTSPFTFSSSLLKAASAGQTFVLSEVPDRVVSTSIADLGIHSAICTPLLVDGGVSGLLYLDARAAEASVQRDAAEFCEAVASVLVLAWGNIKRAALERRQQELTAELDAAREVQETVMPAPRGSAGPIAYAVVSRPGVFVAGDLFDVLPLPGACVAVCLGDVAGHGAGSGLLMALTQSHLSAILASTGNLAQSVEAVNRYLCGFALQGRFTTLWVGVFHPDRSVEFVDAGHGHWFVRHADGTISEGPVKGGVPLGVSDDSRYVSGRMTLAQGDRVFLYSDGVVEQRDPQGVAFGAARVRAASAIKGVLTDDVSRVFTQLDAFAGRTNLDDDATIAAVELL